MSLLSADNMVKYSLSEENPAALKNAIDALNKKDVYLVGFSGKKGSGKDTMAEIFKRDFEQEYGPASFSPFAEPLKGEATSIIAFLWQWLRNGQDSESSMLARFGVTYDLSAEQALAIYNLLRESLIEAELPFDGWTRTMVVWTLLRMLGTDIRQPQDKIYWVRRTVHSIISNANNGISTIVQDTRFPHEIEALRDMGSYIARVDIDPEAQLRRLSSRDGVVPDVAALTHSSEIALDDYPFFNIRTDNSEDGQQNRGAGEIWSNWRKTVSK